MVEIENDLIRTTIRGLSRILILWLLSKKSMSGYSILKEMRRLTYQNMHSGIVYPLLYELEKTGCINGEWEEKGQRKIKTYTITGNGIRIMDNLRIFFKMPLKEVLNDLIKENVEISSSRSNQIY